MIQGRHGPDPPAHGGQGGGGHMRVKCAVRMIQGRRGPDPPAHGGDGRPFEHLPEIDSCRSHGGCQRQL
jgi:hypothetical protein